MKKENLLYPVLILLAASLAVVGLLSLVFRNRPALLRHKIKLGLIIISIQAMIYGCGTPADTGDVIECYAKPIEPDEMSLVCERYDQGIYIFDVDENNTLRINVSNRQGNAFSWALLDTNRTLVIQRGALMPVDLSLNSDWEELAGLIRKDVVAGIYDLCAYNIDSSQITVDSPVKISYRISIVNN